MAARDAALLLRWNVGNPVESVAISHGGTRIASGSADCLVCIWDMHTGSLIRGPFKGHTDLVRSVAWSQDDTRVFSGSDDHTIRTWDARTGALIGYTARGHADSVLSVAFSPDNTRIASSSHDNTIRIWDTLTGTPIGEPLKGHYWSVNSLAFSHDSTRIVSGSLDKTIRIWDAFTGAPMGNSLVGHAESVLSIALSLDSTRIASGSVDKTIRIWDARTGDPIGQPLRGHTDWVLSVAFSPDSTLIVSGSVDGAVHIWDTRTGAQICNLVQGHTSTVSSVAFSHSGTHIVSGSGDGTICVWIAPQGTPSPDRVMSDMSTEEIFKCLVEHGCTDLTCLLDNAQYSSLPIEHGGFGDVWRVALSNGSVVAVKTLRLKTLQQGNSKAAKRVAREVYYWSKLRHPNVQELSGVVVLQGGLGMVSPWRKNGHLKGYLAQHPEVPRYPLCIQLASGVSYLHSLDMVHGDLKANNVLVTDEGIVKINDFDHSVLAESTLHFSRTNRPGGGTLRWMAPELLQSDDDGEDEETQPEAVRSKETDVYALGMTMLEILTGNVPYHEYQHDMGLYHAIHMRVPPRRPHQLPGPDPQATAMWGLLLRCWSHDALARPKADLVLGSVNSYMWYYTSI